MSKTVAALLSTLVLVAACSKPKPVDIAPRSVRVAALRPEGIDLTVELDVHNPNTFAIRASAVSAVLEVENGAELGRGSSLPAFTIPAEGRITLPAALTLQWTNLSVLAPYALGGQPVPYRVRGMARVGGESLNLDLPFTISGQLSPDQVVKLALGGATSLTPKR